MLAKPLPTLPEAELADIWSDCACIPDLEDRLHSFKTSLFWRLELDWRNPNHAQHVAEIASKIAPHVPAHFKRMTND